MNSIKAKKLVMPLLLAVMFCAMPGHAQNEPTQADNYVTNTGFKNRVFEIQNRSPEDIYPVIAVLASGFKGALIGYSREFRTITVRDFPENIAAIEAAIKRLDKPDASRPDIELRMHVLLASTKEGTADQFPPDLKDVIKELQSTLNFKDYSLVTSIVQRTRESRGTHIGYLEGRGSAEVAWPVSAATPAGKRTCNYQFHANSVAISSNSSSLVEILLGEFSFSLEFPGTNSVIHSDIKMRDGERVVVGTAGFGEKAIILVMTARVLK